MIGNYSGINQIDRPLINLSFPKEELYFFFDTSDPEQKEIDWSRIDRFFIVVKRPDATPGGGTGHLIVDHVQYDTAAGFA